MKALNIVDTSASDDGDLVKTSAGKLVLSRNNSYTGATTVSAGTLAAARAAVKFSWTVTLKLLGRTRLFPAGGANSVRQACRGHPGDDPLCRSLPKPISVSRSAWA